VPRQLLRHRPLGDLRAEGIAERILCLAQSASLRAGDGESSTDGEDRDRLWRVVDHLLLCVLSVSAVKWLVFENSFAAFPILRYNHRK
jgi:hypothetical protein